MCFAKRWTILLNWFQRIQLRLYGIVLYKDMDNPVKQVSDELVEIM